MGLPESWIRTDDKAGSVDLSTLALPQEDWERPENISFRTISGLWYELRPLEDTEILPDDTLYPVHLEFGSAARLTGSIIEEAGLAIACVKKWITERRHFPKMGAVLLLNTVVTEGDRLTINGRETSPVDVAWVTERVDPASDVRPSRGIGRRLPSGKEVMEWSRVYANF